MSDKCIAHFDKKVTDYQMYVDRSLQNQDIKIKSLEDYLVNTCDSIKKLVTDLTTNGLVTKEEFNGLLMAVNEQVTNVTTAITDLNESKFAVFSTIKPLTNATGDQWVQYNQVKYGCGYGVNSYIDENNERKPLPKIGDLIVCTTNGYLYKVAGINESNQTICCWFISI